MDAALDDVMVAWAMNGEMLRPENGYPLRLVVPNCGNNLECDFRNRGPGRDQRHVDNCD